MKEKTPDGSSADGSDDVEKPVAKKAEKPAPGEHMDEEEADSAPHEKKKKKELTLKLLRKKKKKKKHVSTAHCAALHHK